MNQMNKIIVNPPNVILTLINEYTYNASLKVNTYNASLKVNTYNASLVMSQNNS
jgi:hypothetical protein